MTFVGTAWKVIQILYVIFKFAFDKYHSDPAFKAELDAAAGLVKTAKTSEEELNAAKAFQDALFR